MSFLNNSIKFSIITPVYNVEKYVKKCIDSVLNQTYKNFELIIINDGSPDNSDEIIKSFNDDRIKYIKRENRGAQYSRVEGIDLATGDYIIFVDSDDYLDDNTLEIYYKEISNNRYDIVRGNYKVFDSSKFKKITNFKCENLIINNDFENKIIVEMAKTDNYNSIWREAIKRDLIDTKNIDTSIFMGEDLLFNFNLYQKARNIKLITASLYNYRNNDESITKIKNINKIKKSTDDVLKILSIIIDDVKNNYNKKTLDEWYLRYLRQVNHSIYRIIKNDDIKNNIEYFKNIFNNKQLEEIRKNLKKSKLISFEYIFLNSIYNNNLESYLRKLKLFSKVF